MNQLQILFTDGEYAEPKRILQGLEPQHVSKRLNHQGHSIYEELYHLVDWQEFVLWRIKNPDEERSYDGTGFPPTQALASETEWQDLVKTCLRGIEEVIAFAGQSEHWDNPLGSGDTVRERLAKLAVHNAYHFGKIVMLRQNLGIWEKS
jgi:DinB superfamily